MLKMYFRAAVRNLWKNKTYSFLNVLGLAIGISCAGLIFLWVEDEVNYDNFHVKKDRLYRVNVNADFDGNVYTMGSTPRPLAAAIMKEIPGIANAARFSDVGQRLLCRVGDKSLYLSGRLADSSLFSMFTLHFSQGNARNAFSQLYSLVITKSTAKKLFEDDKDVIGKIVRVDNKENYTVTGVIDDLPSNSTLQFEWLAPYDINLLKHDADDWGSFGPYTYVELDKAASLPVVNARLLNYLADKSPGKKKEAFLHAMSDWRMYDEFKNGKSTGSGRIREVRLLSAIAWIILVIACINFMNLATANSQKRSKEIGIHKTLGAGRQRLALQFMGEALMMSFLSALVAILLIVLALPLFNLFMQKQLVADITNPVHLIALLIIAIISGLIAGSYPSIYMSSFKPVLVLKGSKCQRQKSRFEQEQPGGDRYAARFCSSLSCYQTGSVEYRFGGKCSYVRSCHALWRQYG
jgi:putative ABC transport system permease protein